MNEFRKKRGGKGKGEEGRAKLAILNREGEESLLCPWGRGCVDIGEQKMGGESTRSNRIESREKKPGSVHRKEGINLTSQLGNKNLDVYVTLKLAGGGLEPTHREKEKKQDALQGTHKFRDE